MIVANQIKTKIESFPEGYVFSLADFDLKGSSEIALAKLLSRMATKGEICRASKGKYYKPRNTIFGMIGPAYNELVKEFLIKDGIMVGYVTGTAAFSEMGLTTQITQELLIGTNKYRRPLMRNGYKVRFLKQDNVITEENVELLRLLDAIRLIREIPAVTPDDACKTLMGLMQMLTDERRSEMELLALKYTNYVRAMAGAMFEGIGVEAPLLRSSLNWTSSYAIPVSERVLPSKRNWRIV